VNEPRRRAGSIGCLGCFGFVCLTILTLVEVGVIWCMDPGWFDRLAFWRGERYERDVVFVTDPVERARLEEEDVKSRETPKPSPWQPRVPVPLDFARATVAYDPATGATLSEPGGAVMKLPPGAIPVRTEVSITPVVNVPPEVAMPLAGPAYRILIGGQYDYQFLRPVEFSLPYENAGEGEELAIAFWEGGKWEPVPSTMDRQARRVTAQIRHTCDPFTVGGAVYLVKLTVATGVAALSVASATSTGRGKLAGAAFWRNEPVYDTPGGEFKIHYTTKGDHAVPDDAAYARSGAPMPGAGDPKHPAYVRRLGELLDQCTAGFRRGGIKMKVPSVRHDVFVRSSGTTKEGNIIADSGNSDIGGPMELSSTYLAQAVALPTSADEYMRFCVAHELTHVAQDLYFNNVSALGSRWWIEAMAEYIANWYWRKEGKPVSFGSFYLKADSGALLRTAICDAGEPDYYAYFVFPRWLDDRHSGAGFRVVRSFSESLGYVMSPSLAKLDAAVQKEIRGSSLAGVFTEFAKDFYHDDLWSGGRFPEFHGKDKAGTPRPDHIQRGDQGAADKNFQRVTYAIDGRTALRNDYAAWGHDVKIPRLSAHALYMDVAPLPREQKAKLVVRVTPAGTPSSDLHVYLTEDECRETALPYSGTPGPFQELALSAGKPVVKVVDLVGQKGRSNLVTVLIVNTSFEYFAGSRIVVDRWILLPPAMVTGTRAAPGSNTWNVSWHKVPLEKHGNVFKHYTVWWRKRGEPDSALRVVRSTTNSSLDYQAEVADDLVFTVTVVDQLGN